MYHDGNVVPRAASSMASSRATIDTALYTNLRGGVPGERGGPSSNGNSRPSSMLFNDSGFVR